MCEANIMTNSSISVLDSVSSTSANIVASILENKTARSFFDRAVSFFGLDRFSKYFYFYFYFYFTSNGFVTL